MNKKIQERIERFQRGEVSESTMKKRKLSGTLVIINIAMLIIILIFFRQVSDKKDFNAGISYDNLSYTFNIKRNAKEKGPVFSAFVTSLAAEEREHIFNVSVGSITLKYKDAVVYEGNFGDKIESLRLKPEEVKKITLRVDETGINDLIDENPDSVVPKRKSYLFNQQQYVPLEANIKINTIKPVTLRLDFNYEID
ncbi:MAG: hypothetical protein MUC95_10515 [Spirochaetes bacterium]|nr:hypothetical protein [Spirochaetota bacterium]